VVTTLDKWMKSKIEVSANWCVTVEHWKLSLIRVPFVNYQTSVKFTNGGLSFFLFYFYFYFYFILFPYFSIFRT